MAIETKKKKNRPKIGSYTTPRDYHVLKTLWNYKIIRISALHQLCFANKQNQRNVQDILKTRLVNRGYIKPIYGTRAYLERAIYTDEDRIRLSQDSYCITAGGLELILRDVLIERQRQGFAPDEKWVWQRYKDIERLARFKTLAHELDVSSIRACLDLAVAKLSDVELVFWYDERHRDENEENVLYDEVDNPNQSLNEGKPLPVRPDSCFMLRDKNTDKRELFFVECDEGNEQLNLSKDKKTWATKVIAYREYGQQGFPERWGLSGFRVLTIHRSLTGREQYKRQAGLVDATIANSGRKRFWFASFAELMPGEQISGDNFLTAPIWQRAVPEEFETNTKVVLGDYLFDRDRK